MKRLSVIATLCTWMLTATIALATPASLFVATPIARATFGAAINTSQMAGAQSVIQQLIIAPGGHTGWHTHPGGTVILVQAGTFSLYNNACAKTVTEANRGVVEPGGHVQLARNETTGLLLLTVVYFDVPVGGAVRSNAETPACAVGADANNLPEGPAGSGITFNVPGGIVQRSTFAAASIIAAGAERDVFLQRVTIAPGGHSGWHSHPGATVVSVESGTLSLYEETCVKHSYPAGQGAVEPANHRVLARNEGASPAVVRVVFFDVPVAGSARIDQPEPATCTGLVAGATPQTLPSTSVEAGVSTGLDPAIVAVLVALASVVGLAMIRRSRARSRIG
ncbi:MAG: cupin domain-containing protein [Candidatus Limnocylindria bacterium]